MRVPARLAAAPAYYNQSWARTFVSQLEQFFESLAGPLELTSEFRTRNGRVRKVTLVTDVSHTLAKADDIVDVNYAGAVALTLPTSPEMGRAYTVQDSSGNASANPITITPAAGTINGASTLAISADYGGYDFYYNGTLWLAR